MKKVSIRVHPDAVPFLEEKANAMGVPVSTWISYYLSDLAGVERLDLRVGYAKLAERRKQDAVARRSGEGGEPSVCGGGVDSGISVPSGDPDGDPQTTGE